MQRSSPGTAASVERQRRQWLRARTEAIATHSSLILRTLGGCPSCQAVEGTHSALDAPQLPVAGCTGDGPSRSCLCRYSVEADDAWERREGLLLEAIWDRQVTGDLATLRRSTRLAAVDAAEGVRALIDRGYVRAIPLEDGGYGDICLAPRGLREMGDWPPESGYRNVTAQLEYRIATTPDPGLRAAFERLDEALLCVDKETFDAWSAQIYRADNARTSES